MACLKLEYDRAFKKFRRCDQGGGCTLADLGCIRDGFERVDFR